MHTLLLTFYDDSALLNFFMYFNTSTYRQKLLTLAWLAQSHDAVHVDAGLGLVSVLHETEGLKVEAGDLGKPVAAHRRPLLHRAAGGCHCVGESTMRNCFIAMRILFHTCACAPPYPAKKLCCSVCVML